MVYEIESNGMFVTISNSSTRLTIFSLKTKAGNWFRALTNYIEGEMAALCRPKMRWPF